MGSCLPLFAAAPHIQVDAWGRDTSDGGSRQSVREGEGALQSNGLLCSASDVDGHLAGCSSLLPHLALHDLPLEPLQACPIRRLALVLAPPHLVLGVQRILVDVQHRLRP